MTPIDRLAAPSRSVDNYKRKLPHNSCDNSATRWSSGRTRVRLRADECDVIPSFTHVIY